MYSILVWQNGVKKAEVNHAPQESVGRCSSPSPRPWTCRWRWCVASATPDLQLPSQLQGITAHWLVPNYTSWWRRHMCVNNLPRDCTRQRSGWDSNPRPVDCKSGTLPPSHTMWSVMDSLKYFIALTLLVEWQEGHPVRTRSYTSSPWRFFGKPLLYLTA